MPWCDRICATEISDLVTSVSLKFRFRRPADLARRGSTSDWTQPGIASFRQKPEKRMVYFIHDDGSGVGGGSPTTEDAIDGSWVGANQGESWFAVAVTPGEHHVCAAIQSSWFDQLAELAHFTAEAGKSYFFRTRLFTSQVRGSS